ncbi:hypothetical protein D3C71_919650 [compost metagenome]
MARAQQQVGRRAVEQTDLGVGGLPDPLMVFDPGRQREFQTLQTGSGVGGAHEGCAEFDEGRRDVSLIDQRGDDARRHAGEKILAFGLEPFAAEIDADGHAQRPASELQERSVRLEVRRRHRGRMVGPGIARADMRPHRRARVGRIAVGIEEAIHCRPEGRRRYVRP